jgi:hypothetical protein
MALAGTTPEIQNRRQRQTLSEATGDHRVHHQTPWYEPIKEQIERVDIEALRQENLKREEERRLQQRLALQLIDVGYKALATKLHPDKGGSREAMSRLNAVRDRLKNHA